MNIASTHLNTACGEKKIRCRRRDKRSREMQRGAFIKLARSSTVRCIPLLTGGLWVQVPPSQRWMRSSMAEQRFVKPRVESSNLSSSVFYTEVSTKVVDVRAPTMEGWACL